MTTLADYNNNPGNLRPPKGVTYEGQIGVDDKGFAIFENKDFGNKALVNDVTRKLEKGIDTPDKFVDRFAPAGAENDEEGRENYKIFLAQQLGLKSTSDPFPKDAAERLAKAVGAFESGTWANPQEQEEKAPEATPAPESQYSGPPIAEEHPGVEANRANKEMAAMGAAIGAGAGSVYTAKAPIFRMAQRVGLLPGGKPIAPSEAAALAERVMTPTEPVESVVRKPHGGENWQKSLTGISTPGAQMDKASLDLAKRMQGAVGIGGAPGFTGGTITPGGIILSPQDATVVQAKQAVAAAKAAESEANLQKILRQAYEPDAVQRGARTVMGSAPVRGGLAGLGVGFNLQDTAQKLREGDVLGGTMAGGATGASALSLVPKIASKMNPLAVGLTTASQVAGDLRHGNKQAAAESGLTGLAALLPRIFGPIGALVYSGGLNQGEDEELAKRRQMPTTIRP